MMQEQVTIQRASSWYQPSKASSTIGLVSFQSLSVVVGNPMAVGTHLVSHQADNDQLLSLA